MLIYIVVACVACCYKTSFGTHFPCYLRSHVFCCVFGSTIDGLFALHSVPDPTSSGTVQSCRHLSWAQLALTNPFMQWHATLFSMCSISNHMQCTLYVCFRILTFCVCCMCCPIYSNHLRYLSLQNTLQVVHASWCLVMSRCIAVAAREINFVITCCFLHS